MQIFLVQVGVLIVTEAKGKFNKKLRRLCVKKGIVESKSSKQVDFLTLSTEFSTMVLKACLYKPYFARGKMKDF